MRVCRLLPLLLLVACTPPPAEAPDSMPGSSQSAGERVVGVVRVVGSAPVNVRVVVQPEGGRAVGVEGPLRAELERLGGAEVAVTGVRRPSPDPMQDGSIEAAGYEILSVGGEPVVMGVVEAVTPAGARLRTAEGELVYLLGAPPELAAGQKVWVQGPRGVVVQTHGIIRP